MAYPCSEQWLTTSAMASRLGIHPKTLLRLRSSCFSPFQEGLHYRRGGLTTRAPFQWHGDRCEEAFTQFGRVDPDREGDLPQAGWSVGAGRAGTDYRSLISVLNLPKRPGIMDHCRASISRMKGPTRKPSTGSVGTRPPQERRDLGGIGSRSFTKRFRGRLAALARSLDERVGGFSDVALVLLAAVLGVPGWLDKPWWARPVVLESIVVVGIYGKGRTERTERERSQNERMAFAATTRDLLHEERKRDAEERERDAEKRKRDAAAEEIATLEAEVAALAAEEQE